MNSRKAIFSGKFYPSNQEELEKLLVRIGKLEQAKIDFSLARHKILGAIVPHAGYIYSAYQAIHPFEIIKQSGQAIDTLVIINPNHSGKGSGEANIGNYTAWETPFGNIQTDPTFSAYLNIDYSNAAHESEHAGEVIMPLIKHYLPKNCKVVVITMNYQNPEVAGYLAEMIVHAQQASKQNILLIASSDFSHFESPDTGFQKDQFLINEILNLNSENAYLQVKKHNISACGFGPIMTLINYAKLTTDHAQMNLLRRGHSGEVHPSPHVVDYASFLCYEKQ